VARSGPLAEASLCPGPLDRDADRRIRSQLLFQLGGHFFQEPPGRHPRKLDHAGAQSRPGDGDCDDVHPGRHPQASGLANDHDPRNPGPRDSFRGLRLPPGTPRARGAGEPRPRDLLRVLLCHGLYFRGCVFSERRAIKRAGALQYDDPWVRGAHRQFDLSDAPRKNLHPRRRDRFPRPLPDTLRDRSRGGGPAGHRFSPAEASHVSRSAKAWRPLIRRGA
jgi:hypothetical protein